MATFSSVDDSKDGLFLGMDINPTVLFYKIDEDAFIPEKATHGSAGRDIRSIEDVILPPGDRKLISTGLAVILPEGTEAQIRPRSGLAIKHGITVINSPATIDSDYRGELKIPLINHGKEEFRIRKYDRVAQIVISKVITVNIEEALSLPDTERGSGGFGSTGR